MYVTTYDMLILGSISAHHAYGAIERFVLHPDVSFFLVAFSNENFAISNKIKFPSLKNNGAKSNEPVNLEAINTEDRAAVEELMKDAKINELNKAI